MGTIRFKIKHIPNKTSHYKLYTHFKVVNMIHPNLGLSMENSLECENFEIGRGLHYSHERSWETLIAPN